MYSAGEKLFVDTEEDFTNIYFVLLVLKDLQKASYIFRWHVRKGKAIRRKVKMRIEDGRWTKKVNMLKIECTCGNYFEHRTDRWNVRCPNCYRRDSLYDIRIRYFKECQRRQGNV